MIQPSGWNTISILSLMVSFLYFRNVCVRVCARMVWHSILSVARGCTPTFVCGEQRRPALFPAALFPWVRVSQCRHACSHTWLFTWTCRIWTQILTSAQPMLFPQSRPSPSWAIYSRQSGAKELRTWRTPSGAWLSWHPDRVVYQYRNLEQVTFSRHLGFLRQRRCWLSGYPGSSQGYSKD